MISVYAIRHCRSTCILLIVLLLLLLPTSRLWLFFPVLGILFNSCVNYCSFFYPVLVIVTLNRHILFIVYSLLSFVCRLLLLSKIGNIRNYEYWISNFVFSLIGVVFIACSVIVASAVGYLFLKLIILFICLSILLFIYLHLYFYHFFLYFFIFLWLGGGSTAIAFFGNWISFSSLIIFPKILLFNEFTGNPFNILISWSIFHYRIQSIKCISWMD